MFSMYHLCVMNFLFMILTTGLSLNDSTIPETEGTCSSGFYPSAQDHAQVAFDYSQEQELHSLYGQPVPILGHSHGKSFGSG